MKILKGTVISTKMNKTAVVTVERRWQHPLYKKIIKRDKKYLVQDDFQVRQGEEVLIQEVRPISRRKRWKIIKRKVDEKKSTAKTRSKKNTRKI